MNDIDENVNSASVDPHMTCLLLRPNYLESTEKSIRPLPSPSSHGNITGNKT
jgi:hypothetical protein